VPKKKTSAHRTPWTKEDVHELKAHSKVRTPLPEIAKKMKRTEGALGERRGSSALVSAIIAELCFRGSRQDRRRARCAARTYAPFPHSISRPMTRSTIPEDFG
jgi:hypothetical protein